MISTVKPFENAPFLVWIRENRGFRSFKVEDGRNWVNKYDVSSYEKGSDWTRKNKTETQVK